MRYVYENRAALVLYKFLRSNPRDGDYLLPANVCPIVVAVFLKAQVPFRFLDISPKTLCLDFDLLDDLLRSGREPIAGVVYVATYGACLDLSARFAAIKDRSPGILIIDDRCLCEPRCEHNPNANLTLYSTGYSKFVDLGFGGYGILKDEMLYVGETLILREEAHRNLARALALAIDCGEHFNYVDSDWLGGGFRLGSPIICGRSRDDETPFAPKKRS